MNRCFCGLRRMARDILRSSLQHHNKPVYTARFLSITSNFNNNDDGSEGPLMIRLIDINGKSLGLMSQLEAEKVAKTTKSTTGVGRVALKHVVNASETITNAVYKLVELKTPSTLRNEKRAGKSNTTAGGGKKQQQQHQAEKELTMKSQIQDNDLDVKARKLQQFIDKGFRVTLKIVKPRRVNVPPRDTYERLVSRLNCAVVLQGTPKASDSFFRGTVVAAPTPKPDKSELPLK